ncbi:MAG: cysteine dioxygenase [Pseudonocardiaceae bacterium]|nr:cysteine dioxygenase [Pseudonocardiaceae bacterium]
MWLAAHPERWLPLIDHAAGTRRLLDHSPDEQVWLLSWLPGQGTGVHDHGPASGAFAVAAGTLTEHVAGSSRAGTPRQLDAGRARAFGPHYVHELANTGTIPAVSVHVYTPEPFAMSVSSTGWGPAAPADPAGVQLTDTAVCGW